MASGATSGARATTSTGVEIHARRKRQADNATNGCDTAYNTDPRTSQRYNVTSCKNGTVFMAIEGGISKLIAGQKMRRQRR